MVSVVEIPTIPAPQTFTIALNGTTYTIRLTWCIPAQCWMMDIADQGDTPIALGIPLITGADLLAQLAYLSIGNGGAMVVQSDNDPALVPSFTTLGSTGHLFFVSPNP